MLTSASFGDDALLLHSTCKQCLAERVVDLVSAGMKQVFPLQVDACASELFSQAASEEERRWSSGEVVKKRLEFSMELRICLGDLVFALEFLQGSHQGLRDVAPTVWTEASDLLSNRIQRSSFKT